MLQAKGSVRLRALERSPLVAGTTPFRSALPHFVKASNVGGFLKMSRLAPALGARGGSRGRASTAPAAVTAPIEAAPVTEDGAADNAAAARDDDDDAAAAEGECASRGQVAVTSE